eukprot:1175819-Prorocentrum_minimum.AAC.2
MGVSDWSVRRPSNLSPALRPSSASLLNQTNRASTSCLWNSVSGSASNSPLTVHLRSSIIHL